MLVPMGTLVSGLFALAGGIASSRPQVPPDRGPDPARQPTAAAPAAPYQDPYPAHRPQEPDPTPVKAPRAPVDPITEVGHAIAGSYSLDALKDAHTRLIGAFTTGKISLREYNAGSSQVLPTRKRLLESDAMLAETTSRGQLAQHRAAINTAQTPDALLHATQALWNDPSLSAEHRTVANLELNKRRSDVTNLALQQNVRTQRDAVPQGRHTLHTDPGYQPLYPTREPEVAQPILPTASNTLPRARRGRG